MVHFDLIEVIEMIEETADDEWEDFLEWLLQTEYETPEQQNN